MVAALEALTEVVVQLGKKNIFGIDLYIEFLFLFSFFSSFFLILFPLRVGQNTHTILMHGLLC